jgi:hypothetical protein
MKKLSLILATAIGIFLVIGSVVATLVISPLLTAGANGNAAANSSSASGAIVIAWNKELLHIVLTPGAQPATVHPTRSFAILHAGRASVPVFGERSQHCPTRRSGCPGRP